MNYRAEFKKTFIKDFNEIVESLPEKAAEKFGPKFTSKIQQIINFPESCPRLHEPHYDECGIRWVPIIEKYILIYQFEKEKISFLRLLPAKSNWIHQLFK